MTLVKDQDGGRWALLMAMVLSGTIGIVVVVSGLAPQQIVFWRCVFGLPLLLAAQWSKPWPRLTIKQWALALLSGALLVANWLLIFSAYDTLSVGMATVIYNTQPLFLVMLGIVFLKEKLSWAGWGWLSMAFVGMLCVVAIGAEGMHHRPQSGLGIALALGAALCYALMAILTRYLKAIPPTFLALIQVGTGVLILWPFSWTATGISVPQWGWLLVLGVVHTGIMYQLLLFAIQKLRAVTVASFSFIYPFLAVVLDALILGQTFTLAQLLGGLLILLSAAGINLRWGDRR